MNNGGGHPHHYHQQPIAKVHPSQQHSIKTQKPTKTSLSAAQPATSPHQPPITLLGGLTSPQSSNNSDYNLIFAQHHHPSTNKLQTHQTLTNIANNGATTNGLPVTSSLPLNASDLLYSNVSKLPKSPKSKKVTSHTNGTANGTAILDDNEDEETYDASNCGQKQIDLTHMMYY